MPLLGAARVSKRLPAAPNLLTAAGGSRDSYGVGRNTRLVFRAALVCRVVNERLGRDSAADCARAMEEAAECRISAANYLEAAIVIDGSRDPIASRRFDDLIREAHVLIEPVTEDQAKLAREAYRDFGRGSGHAAQLNFGDCFAYALAKAAGEPLLFKGKDFTRTDLVRALQ